MEVEGVDDVVVEVSECEMFDWQTLDCRQTKLAQPRAELQDSLARQESGPASPVRSYCSTLDHLRIDP